ncbi:MAG: hypothetical protein US75_C0046G0007 [Candidatus Woesebacteria bacterium GW2011_GWC1_38_13]|uniref:Uncharacterized protein n=2 Tax=Candidatus Woeseibacteriota TaxID=1752722 RepID=A0A0G0NF01_9BACT|nr:MAG: hypothetical protein US75_C0046G0007 [Candidatus Woesebacteria bacterium GW2011_GWC1_38_13]KKQ84484.1 MAG: hypothetical protein UT06_C0004G0020 [Candidatus Woesebacteria bacterium GW2011_GWA1_38_8]
MQLTDNSKVYVLILLGCAIFSLLSVTFGFFPYLGFSVSFILFLLLAFYIKNDKTSLTKVFFTIALILSIFLSIRSEPFITLLNILAIFYFSCLFVLTKKDDPDSIFSIILAPLMLFLQSAFIKNNYRLEFEGSVASQKKRESALNMIAVLLVTLTILAIILPLLASANPLFERLLLSAADLIGLRGLKIDEAVLRWVVRLIIFTGLAYLIPRIATFVNKKEGFKITSRLALNLLIPKTAVAVVLAVFFIAQFQLYFSSKETLAALGYTYSNYANEVFAQLSIVAVIIMGLVYADTEKKKVNEKLALILIIEGIFLTFMAYKSVYEYSNAWGFTYKRLYGFAVATWILGIFSIYLYTFIKNVEKNVFLAKSAVYTGIILILINLANFDYLIYNFRRATTGAGVDYNYLSRLSSDSLSYGAQLNLLLKDFSDPATDLEKSQAESQGFRVLLHKIDFLQEKYKDFDIREYNLLEYLQYREVKNVDTKFIRDKYTLTNPADR